MHDLAQQNLFLVKEHIGLFKAANNYDIFDPQTGDEILHCREPNLGSITKMLRFTDYKRMTPFDIHVTTPDGCPVVRIKRGMTFFRSHVHVLDENAEPIGSFRQKLLTVGGAFQVLDVDGQPLCMLKGKWTSWEFTVATVTKKWAGFGKEMLTSADNYILQIDESVEPDNPIRLLILAAVMCIDMVLKE
jgi:uncharacterized protein YxjI